MALNEQEYCDFFVKNKIDPILIASVESLRKSADMKEIPEYEKWNGTSVSLTLAAVNILQQQSPERNWEVIEYGERMLDGCRMYLQEHGRYFSGPSGRLAHKQLDEFQPMTFTSQYTKTWCIIL